MYLILLNFQTQYVTLEFPCDLSFSFLCSLNTHSTILSFPILLIHSITIPTTHSIAPHPILCYAMLCHIVLRHTIPCQTISCHNMQCYAVLCHTMLSCAMLCDTILFYAMPCRVMYSIVIYSTHHHTLPLRLIKLTNFNLSQIIIIK